jgi:membrane-bound serine protease (ClpP class)
MALRAAWFLFWLLVSGAGYGASAGPAYVLTLDGAVSPATADYTVRGIRRAAEAGAALVVLRLDTPGGLDTSMRRIIREILSSSVPVVAFVAPSGARAASAGTYILYASHIAVMAPATNLGAATPVQIGISPATDRKRPKDKDDSSAEDSSTPDTLKHKQVNDAAAYIRGLAQLRGRNAEWGEQAVREAVSLSAAEAKDKHVIDLIAEDLNGLLKALDGRKVTVLGAERTLHTTGAETIFVEPDWRTRLLAIIAEPSVALILMMVGVYGLIFEFANPGFVLPGVAGGICLLLALFAFQLLPVNYAGLGLILLGIACIIAEAFLPSFGTLGIGGVIALAIGSVILIEPSAAGYGVPLPFTIALALVSGAVVFFIVSLAARARRRPVVSGREELLGARGVVTQDMQREGWARVHGETWRIVSRMPLVSGQGVRVVGIDGLTLSVEPEAMIEEGGAK